MTLETYLNEIGKKDRKLLSIYIRKATEKYVDNSLAKDIEVRFLGKNEVPLILKLEHVFPEKYRTSYDTYSKFLKRKQSVAVGVFYKGEIIGVAIAIPYGRDLPGYDMKKYGFDAMYLFSIAVHENYRKKGIGKLLHKIRAMISYIMGYRILVGHSLAPEFHKKMGFKIVAYDMVMFNGGYRERLPRIEKKISFVDVLKELIEVGLITHKDRGSEEH